jgi:putative DNA primase/helicase
MMSEAQKAARAANKAQALVEAARPASADHPYLARKQIAPLSTVGEIPLTDAVRILGYEPQSDGAKLVGRLLVIPVYVDGVLSTVELIDEHGLKSALSGGRKGRGYWPTAPLPDCDWIGDLTILIGEGMATVTSAATATGHLGVAALSCGNLLAVGKMLRERYPEARLIFLADLGIGEKKCVEAARAVGGLVATPQFGET